MVTSLEVECVKLVSCGGDEEAAGNLQTLIRSEHLQVEMRF